MGRDQPEDEDEVASNEYVVEVDSEDEKREKEHSGTGQRADREAKMGNSFDMGHWLNVFGGGVMIIVLGFVFLALIALPWWTKQMDEKLSGATAETSVGVTLWQTTTVQQLEFDDVVHEGCDNACDQTRVIREKVRVRVAKWDDLCRPSDIDPTLRANCNKILVLRGSLASAGVLGFIYAAPAIISFAGSEHRSAIRFPPACGVALAAAVFVVLLSTPVVASTIEMEQEFNGEGLYIVVAGLFLTALCIGCSIMANQVVTAIQKVVDEEWALGGAPPKDNTIVVKATGANPVRAAKQSERSVAIGWAPP